MQERGLLPEFSAAVMAEVETLTHAAIATDTAVRDLRNLLWASIDNDDSRDLDQLSVAGSAADGVETIFVAVADVDALVAKGSEHRRTCRGQHDIGVHGSGDFSDASGKALDQPDVPQSG